MIRSRAAIALFALLGVAAAIGLGLALNEISGDSIGLSAEPLKAGERLAPSEARDDGRTRERRRTRHRRRRGRGSDRPESVPGVTLTEPGEDDRGGGAEPGDDRGRGGEDRSGPGSESSGGGSGSSGSGSGSSGSGSGSSGSGSGSSGGGSNSGPGSDD